MNSRLSWLVLLLYLAGGCDMPGKPKPEDQFVSPQKELTFNVLFKQNCVGCHGADGQLGPAPPLNDPLFRSIVPEKDLESVIARGRAGTLMPAFGLAHGGTLTAVQIKVLCNELKGIPYKIVDKREGNEVVQDPQGIHPEWGVPHPREGVPSYLASAQTDGNHSEGIRVFARACASCHGEHGQGGEKGAINDPVFLALISDQALRRLVITGRHDLGMPDYTDATGREDGFKPLTSQEITEVVALLAHWRQPELDDVKGN
jgi:mono/diheme cytochrome c family protein